MLSVPSCPTVARTPDALRGRDPNRRMPERDRAASRVDPDTERTGPRRACEFGRASPTVPLSLRHPQARSRPQRGARRLDRPAPRRTRRRLHALHRRPARPSSRPAAAGSPSWPRSLVAGAAGVGPAVGRRGARGTRPDHAVRLGLAGGGRRSEVDAARCCAASTRPTAVARRPPRRRSGRPTRSRWSSPPAPASWPSPGRWPAAASWRSTTGRPAHDLRAGGRDGDARARRVGARHGSACWRPGTAAARRACLHWGLRAARPTWTRSPCSQRGRPPVLLPCGTAGALRRRARPRRWSVAVAEVPS